MALLLPASQSLYESNADEITRKKCRARENYISLERTLAEQETRLADWEAALATKDAALADKDKIIENLKKQFAEIQSAN